MATNIRNTAPYFDDFDKSKNFHQILFRPGFAVQARELTQIQSIIKNQIEQFGNHIFRQGSIVIPGNSRGELYVPYIKINATYNSTEVNALLFEGVTIRGQTTGVTAIVRKVVVATSTDPITFYINYMSGGVIDGEPNGILTFSPDEIIVIEGTPHSCRIQTGSAAIGTGSLAYVNTGVYYVNGTFVHVDTQSVVLGKYTSIPSCHVLLKINEEVITAYDDATLLDPAQGSYNFAAPGADRIKISLELTTLPIDSTISDDYVEIMRFRNGVLEEHASNPRYNELEKSLARRTYDESGDYVVNGLLGVLTEHRRESNNGGLYENGDIDKFAVTITPGKAYIKGFEVEKISPTVFSLDKARTSSHVGYKNISTKVEYGKYIYVTKVKGNLGVATRSEFTLFNDNDPLNSSATILGTGRIISLDYHAGTPSTNDAIYKLYYSSLTLSGNNDLIDVGGIRIGNNGSVASATVLHKYDSVVNTGMLYSGDIVTAASTARTATVHYWNQSMSEVYVYKHDHTKSIPKIGDLYTIGTVSAIVKNITNIVVSGKSTTIFPLPATVVKSIRDQSGSYAHRYVVQKHVTIATNSAGTGSVSISNGTFQPPEVGTFAAFSNSGVVDLQLFSTSGTGTQLSITGGPASTTINVICAVEKVNLAPRTKTLVTGTTTISSYTSGQRIFPLTNADVYSLVSITDNTGDITSNFTLDNGQTDYFYNNGSVYLNTNISLSGTITITYKYFNHSAGDFFTIDSYANNVGYENYILNYKTSTGDIVELRNHIDFRSTWNGSSYTSSDIIINQELFRCALQFYMGRYDLLIINKDRNVEIIQGVPADVPNIPATPIDSLALEHYYIPAYTTRVSDIAFNRYNVTRHTMADITALANRIQRIEEYSTLNAAESELIAYDVIDSATGLNRFKTGFLVESFNQPLTIADVTSTQFKATFDKGVVVPSMDTMICPATIIGNTSTIRNSVAFVPYTEKIFAQQNVSSRVTNLNPFMVVKWDGILNVRPSSDSWIDVLDLPTIFNETTETVVVTRWVPAPINSPAQPLTPSISVINSTGSRNGNLSSTSRGFGGGFAGNTTSGSGFGGFGSGGFGGNGGSGTA